MPAGAETTEYQNLDVQCFSHYTHNCDEVEFMNETQDTINNS